MITRKNDAFDAKIVSTRLTKILIAIFAPDERLPSSATLVTHSLLGLVCSTKATWLKCFHIFLFHLCVFGSNRLRNMQILEYL